MKVIAKTTSNFCLLDPVSRDLLSETPAVITWSAFFEARAGKGQIKTLESNLPDEASNDEFQEFLKDAESIELAVAAFASTFEEPEPALEPQKPAPKKAAVKKPEPKAEA